MTQPLSDHSSAAPAELSTLCTSVYNRGTTVYMVNDRRPRIPVELAEQIDSLREDTTFEKYIHEVLREHAARRLGPPKPQTNPDAGREGVYEYVDHGGAALTIERITAGDNEGRVLLYVDDEGYEPVGVYLEGALAIRALRDVCTELLGEYGTP